MNNEKRNIELIKRFHLTANVGDRTFHNGFEYVDLGLPSGTLWATMNVGAESIEDCGWYFQWGDTQGYTIEQVEKGKKVFNWDGYKFRNKYDCSFTKYTQSDGKFILDLEDDAAHVNLGGSWRMPTIEEISELRVNTLTEKASINGINGLKFINRNGCSSKYIFVPFYGFAYDNSVTENLFFGQIWSSVVDDSSAFALTAYSFSICGSNNANSLNVSSRCSGKNIRGVLNS